MSVDCCIPIIQRIVGVSKDCVGSNYELEIGSEKRTAWENHNYASFAAME